MYLSVIASGTQWGWCSVLNLASRDAAFARVSLYIFKPD